MLLIHARPRQNLCLSTSACRFVYPVTLYCELSINGCAGHAYHVYIGHWTMDGQIKRTQWNHGYYLKCDALVECADYKEYHSFHCVFAYSAHCPIDALANFRHEIVQSRYPVISPAINEYEYQSTGFEMNTLEYNDCVIGCIRVLNA